VAVAEKIRDNTMNNIKPFQLHPELAGDSVEILDFPLCKLLLCNDCNYPWFILVPQVADIEEIYQLDWQQQQQFLNESSLLSEFLKQEFSADKMNVAALGNIVPQLHIHHVVRYKHDLCWPNPIWGRNPEKPYQENELQLLINRIKPKLLAIIADKN
jgi:diadenosine tetraphosphate (Ap4A) HIT family hydrolase